MNASIVAFLGHAALQETPIDLRTRSGFEFTKVLVTGLDNEAVEIRRTVNSTRSYVIALNAIEWVVQS